MSAIIQSLIAPITVYAPQPVTLEVLRSFLETQEIEKIEDHDIITACKLLSHRPGFKLSPEFDDGIPSSSLISCTEEVASQFFHTNYSNIQKPALAALKCLVWYYNKGILQAEFADVCAAFYGSPLKNASGVIHKKGFHHLSNVLAKNNLIIKEKEIVKRGRSKVSSHRLFFIGAPNPNIEKKDTTELTEPGYYKEWTIKILKDNGKPMDWDDLAQAFLAKAPGGSTITPAIYARRLRSYINRADNRLNGPKIIAELIDENGEVLDELLTIKPPNKCRCVLRIHNEKSEEESVILDQIKEQPDSQTTTIMKMPRDRSFHLTLYDDILNAGSTGVTGHYFNNTYHFAQKTMVQIVNVLEAKNLIVSGRSFEGKLQTVCYYPSGLDNIPVNENAVRVARKQLITTLLSTGAHTANDILFFIRQSESGKFAICSKSLKTLMVELLSSGQIKQSEYLPGGYISPEVDELGSQIVNSKRERKTLRSIKYTREGGEDGAEYYEESDSYTEHSSVDEEPIIPDGFDANLYLCPKEVDLSYQEIIRQRTEHGYIEGKYTRVKLFHLFLVENNFTSFHVVEVFKSLTVKLYSMFVGVSQVDGLEPTPFLQDFADYTITRLPPALYNRISFQRTSSFRLSALLKELVDLKVISPTRGNRDSLTRVYRLNDAAKIKKLSFSFDSIIDPQYCIHKPSDPEFPDDLGFIPMHDDEDTLVPCSTFDDALNYWETFERIAVQTLVSAVLYRSPEGIHDSSGWQVIARKASSFADVFQPSNWLISRGDGSSFYLSLPESIVLFLHRNWNTLSTEKTEKIANLARKEIDDAVSSWRLTSYIDYLKSFSLDAATLSTFRTSRELYDRFEAEKRLKIFHPPATVNASSSRTISIYNRLYSEIPQLGPAPPQRYNHFVELPNARTFIKYRAVSLNFTETEENSSESEDEADETGRISSEVPWTTAEDIRLIKMMYSTRTPPGKLDVYGGYSWIYISEKLNRTRSDVLNHSMALSNSPLHDSSTKVLPYSFNFATAFAKYALLVYYNDATSMTFDDINTKPLSSYSSIHEYRSTGDLSNYSSIISGKPMYDLARPITINKLKAPLMNPTTVKNWAFLPFIKYFSRPSNETHASDRTVADFAALFTAPQIDEVNDWTVRTMITSLHKANRSKRMFIKNRLTPKYTNLNTACSVKVEQHSALNNSIRNIDFLPPLPDTEYKQIPVFTSEAMMYGLISQMLCAKIALTIPMAHIEKKPLGSQKPEHTQEEDISTEDKPKYVRKSHREKQEEVSKLAVGCAFDYKEFSSFFSVADPETENLSYDEALTKATVRTLVNPVTLAQEFQGIDGLEEALGYIGPDHYPEAEAIIRTLMEHESEGCYMPDSEILHILRVFGSVQRLACGPCDHYVLAPYKHHFQYRDDPVYDWTAFSPESNIDPEELKSFWAVLISLLTQQPGIRENDLFQTLPYWSPEGITHALYILYIDGVLKVQAILRKKSCRGPFNRSKPLIHNVDGPYWRMDTKTASEYTSELCYTFNGDPKYYLPPGIIFE